MNQTDGTRSVTELTEDDIGKIIYVQAARQEDCVRGEVVDSVGRVYTVDGKMMAFQIWYNESEGDFLDGDRFFYAGGVVV